MEQNKDGNVLDLGTLMRDVLKSWRSILLVAVMAAMIGYIGFQQFYHPQYSADTTLAVSSTNSGSTVLTNGQSAQKLATAFSQVLNSKIMMQKVTTVLGEEFNGTINSSLVDDTNLIVLTVTADTPITAYRVLQTILQNYDTVTSAVMANVVVATLKTPVVPTHPDSGLTAVKTMALAAILGVLAVVLIEGFISFQKNTVKNESCFLSQVDATLLGTVYNEAVRSKRKDSTPKLLISKASASFGFVETFKILRTKVEYKMHKTGSKVLMITSVSANEGKSTVSANLALALAQKGHRVILVDGDIRKPNLHNIFEKKVGTTCALRDLALGLIPPEEMPLHKAPYGLQLLIGGVCQDSADVFGSKGMKQLFDYLREKADYVLIDMPPMVFADVDCVAQWADASLLVVKQNWSGISDINDAAAHLEESRADFLGCVLNNVQTGKLLNFLAQGDGYESGYTHHYGYGYGADYREKADYSNSQRRPDDKIGSASTRQGGNRT